MDKKTMPVCFTKDQLLVLERCAKERGMLNVQQLIDQLINN